jgi:hypothetical protein
MEEEVEYLTCKNCETPCYVFDLDAKGNVAAAMCTMCGNDDPQEFRKADEENEEPSDEDLGPVGGAPR